jgi:hypothetical protein
MLSVTGSVIHATIILAVTLDVDQSPNDMTEADINQSLTD